MTKVQYEVIGNIAGHKRGSVVSLPDGDVPRPYAGRVRKLPKGASAGTITVDILTMRHVWTTSTKRLLGTET